MRPILEGHEISYRYPNNIQALSQVGFSFKEGSKIAIVGANGAGKSTLLLMLNGMLVPTRGEVRFHEKKITYSRSSLRDLRRRIGYVFQDPDRQILAPTVYQDVAFGPANLGYDEDTIRACVSDALHQVGLEGFERRAPHQLSGGEKKRVAIAGILAMDPEVLVLDEPTSMLDPAGSEDIMDLLEELHNRKKTLIISTHDVELVYPWADTIILMSKGQIIAEGPPEEAFADRDLIRTVRLKIPVIMDLYQELVKRGMQKNPRIPRSILDIIKTIECDHHGGMILPGHQSGVIHVADVNEISEVLFNSYLRENDIATIGAMGSRAKIGIRKWGIHPDYTYGVIDKCILQAMNGRSSLILTSGGMVPRVEERVHEFNRENSRRINVLFVNESGQTRDGINDSHESRIILETEG